MHSESLHGKHVVRWKWKKILRTKLHAMWCAQDVLYGRNCVLYIAKLCHGHFGWEDRR